MTRKSVYAEAEATNHQPYAFVHNMCTRVGHEDVTGVGSAKAEARKREGGSYLSADLSTVLTVLAQSTAAVASAESEALA